METASGPAALARRLRALREESRPRLTQTQLGGVLGVSGALVSMWESNRKPVPVDRLADYATYFAAERSAGDARPALPAEPDLDADERSRRDELFAELTALQAVPVDQGRALVRPRRDSLLRFPDGETITIVCGLMPDDVRPDRPYTWPGHPDYEEFFTFADPRALMELYGYLRALNPNTEVIYKTSQPAAVTTSDYSNHLMLIGGVDWNLVTRDLLDQIDLPVVQRLRDTDDDKGGFEVIENGEPLVFEPRLSRTGRLLEDVMHFYRGPNPYNGERTVTLFNGNYGRGTLGAVRALTDPKFRERNEDWVADRFADHAEFSVLARAVIVNDQTATPDWQTPSQRLHEWQGVKVGGDRGSPTDSHRRPGNQPR